MSESFAATEKDGACFMHLRASPNESVRRKGAQGRDRREDDKVEGMVGTERRVDEREGCAFHRDSAVPQGISIVEDGIEMLKFESTVDGRV